MARAFQIVIPDELHERLRRYVFETNTTKKDVVTKALEEFLGKEDKKK